MRTRITSLLILFFAANLAHAQSDAQQVGAILGEEVLPALVANFQVRDFLLERIADPPSPSGAQDWTAQARRLRAHLLNDVVFHGWPKEWVNSPPKFEDLGVFTSGPGYRMRKLRYEIVPGFLSTAILYEPERLSGKVPAILNVNGHVGAPGKAIEYKQKRCINFAKRGMLALNLEWLGMGELGARENQHSFGAHLDLVGAHELGLFYLAMRRGLDYLEQHPNVDRSRLGMTGLSGGGWQTIILSSLDERVAAAVPVAGFSSLRLRMEVRWYGDLGDVEQTAADAFAGVDYSHLVGLRAPRPTLLIYNAEDDCCFRAPLVKPLIFDAIKPIFSLYGQQEALAWHENTDPSTHNFQRDNRIQTYRFFNRHFGLLGPEDEIPSSAEVKSIEELEVGLPKDNLTILGLARKFGAEIRRAPIPPDAASRRAWAASEREKLRQVVRYEPVAISSPWAIANTKNKGIETVSYLFRMANGLSANGVWIKAIETPAHAPATIVLHDQGKKAGAADVSDRVNRGENVLALDLVFVGDAWSKSSQGPFYGPVGPALYGQFVHSVGDRPLGLQAAQLIAIARWMQSRTGGAKVRLESTGIRNQVVALVAAALEPELFSNLLVHVGMRSLAYLLEKPVEFHEAAELFCLDFYKEFDLDRLEALGDPAKVTVERHVEDDGKKK